LAIKGSKAKRKSEAPKSQAWQSMLRASYKYPLVRNRIYEAFLRSGTKKHNWRQGLQGTLDSILIYLKTFYLPNIKKRERTSFELNPIESYHTVPPSKCVT
jgi:hypothetical protein